MDASPELSGPTVGWNQETCPPLVSHPSVLDLIPFFRLSASYVAQCWRQPCSNLSNLLIPLIITQPLFHSLAIPPETSAAHIERNRRVHRTKGKRLQEELKQIGPNSIWKCFNMWRSVKLTACRCFNCRFLLFPSDIFLIFNHDDTWNMSSGCDCSPNYQFKVVVVVH